MKRAALFALAFFTPLAMAATKVEMTAVDAEGMGESIGTVSFEESEYGLLITPDLEGLEAGLHGFHVHENASCEPEEKDGEMTAAAAAGGHFDPEDTGKHRGPYSNEGHLGDLPVLPVDGDGNATTPLLAPRLEVSDLSGRALVIHQDGDNYSDDPKKLGGGGARVACGVIE